jgi:hypothetical protein
VEQPSASSLPFQVTPTPPLIVVQLPRLALLLNPAPGIKFLLDCWVQHLPFVQDWPFPVLQAVVQLPQCTGSVLVFVQVPLHSVVPDGHAHWLLWQVFPPLQTTQLEPQVPLAHTHWPLLLHVLLVPHCEASVH